MQDETKEMETTTDANDTIIEHPDPPDIFDDLEEQVQRWKPWSPEWRKQKMVYVEKSNTTNVLRQSGYIISVINERELINMNAVMLEGGIYFLKQLYTGHPEHETVALVGIPMIHVSSFFTGVSQLIETLRQLPQLSFIQDVHELSCCYTCEILRKFKPFFDNCDSNCVLLLNIEPGGEGKYKRIYPYPRFTIPGGTMESRDCGDYLQCAIREFQEETHILLTNENYELISQKKINRDVRKKRHYNTHSYTKKHYQIFNHVGQFRVESTYFAIRIKYLI
jgi:hypothetical protein